MVLEFRYIDRNYAVQPCFFEFISILDATADLIGSVILKRLNSLFTNAKGKLIVQACNGVSLMKREQADVQQKVCEDYENAHLCALLYTPSEFYHATSCFSDFSSESFLF